MFAKNIKNIYSMSAIFGFTFLSNVWLQSSFQVYNIVQLYQLAGMFDMAVRQSGAQSFELQTLKVDHGLSFFKKLSAQLKVLHDVCSWTTICITIICSIYSISKPFLIQSVTLNCVKNPTLELNMLKRIHSTFISHFFLEIGYLDYKISFCLIRIFQFIDTSSLCEKISMLFKFTNGVLLSVARRQNKTKWIVKKKIEDAVDGKKWMARNGWQEGHAMDQLYCITNESLQKNKYHLQSAVWVPFLRQ